MSPALVLAALLLSPALTLLGAAAPRLRPFDDGPRIVEPEERRRFYRTGGLEHVGRKVHLHVEAAILSRPPEERREPGSRRTLVFANRGVPLVIDAASPYWRAARRDLADAAEFCVHGVVRRAAPGERSRAWVDVTRIQRAPGSRRASRG